MKDAIGNKINNEDLVKWNIPAELIPRLVFTVAHVSDGGIMTPQGVTPPLIQLTVVIPLDMHHATGEPVLPDFVCLRNPKSEGLLDLLSNSKNAVTQ